MVGISCALPEGCEKLDESGRVKATCDTCRPTPVCTLDCAFSESVTGGTIGFEGSGRRYGGPPRLRAIPDDYMFPAGTLRLHEQHSSGHHSGRKTCSQVTSTVLESL